MKLSVFNTYWNFWQHPIRWLKDKIKGLHKAWDRAIKGYCQDDIWELFNWYLNIMPEMLRELAENGVAYPTYYDDRLEWCKRLLNLADKIAALQEEKWDKEHPNPYLEDFEEACMSRYKGSSASDFMEEEYKRIASLFMKEDKKLSELWENLYRDAMQELIKILPECWD